MLATAIIVFREVLEAALVIAIVLGASRGITRRSRWVVGGIALGAFGAGLVALFADAIAKTFATDLGIAAQSILLGAREHNLKDITVRLPRNALICITGLSGSGKSSLAFDTIYAEGQRRYVESLSAYARQFLQMMEKPDVDSIDGLSPAISIDQKTTSRNPRSTVGTVTEIYDYLRLLYARVGRPHCPVCGKPIAGQSIDAIVDQVLRLEEGTRFTVNAPLVRGRKGEFRDVFEELPREGVQLRAVPVLARRADGTYVRWAAYRIRTGRGGASSHLAWDSALAITDMRRPSG